MTASTSNGSAGPRVLATNRKARHEYHVLEKIEAGLELHGTEVKSIRDGGASLAQAFAVLRGGEAFLEGMHVQPYRFGNVHNHEPTRPRKLLLHRAELARLHGQTAVKGHTLIPLRLYLRRGRVKVELGLCRGKQLVDKRETIRRRTADREAERAMRGRRGAG